MVWLALAVSGVCVVATYSLLGAMTGVYRYSLEPFGASGDGYVVRRGERWVGIHGDLSSGGMEAVPLDPLAFEIEPGIWSMTVRAIKTGHQTRAYTPWNPIIIFQLTVGRYSDLGR